MGTSTPPDRPTRIDPLLGAPTVRRDRGGSAPGGTAPSPTSDAERRLLQRPGRTRRPHAASGARALALTASVVATGAVGSALAYSEGAWSTDGVTSADEPIDPGSATTDAAAPTPSSTAAVAAPTETESAPTITSPESTVASTVTQPTSESGEEATEANLVTSGYSDGVYVGTSEYTEWGDVQVEVTISNGQIVDAAAIEFPTGRKSSDINNRAIPQLEAEAVALQSAEVDTVSGATYTSRSYADSLQAALDRAALAASAEATSS